MLHFSAALATLLFYNLLHINYLQKTLLPIIVKQAQTSHPRFQKLRPFFRKPSAHRPLISLPDKKLVVIPVQIQDSTTNRNQSYYRASIVVIPVQIQASTTIPSLFNPVALQSCHTCSNTGFYN